MSRNLVMCLVLTLLLLSTLLESTSHNGKRQKLRILKRDKKTISVPGMQHNFNMGQGSHRFSHFFMTNSQPPQSPQFNPMMEQIPPQLPQSPFNIGFRGMFSNVLHQNTRQPTGEFSMSSMQGTDNYRKQCEFSKKDFKNSKSHYCSWNKELVIIKKLDDMMWCIGYKADKKVKITKELFLTLDGDYHFDFVSVFKFSSFLFS